MAAYAVNTMLEIRCVFIGGIAANPIIMLERRLPHIVSSCCRRNSAFTKICLEQGGHDAKGVGLIIAFRVIRA